MLIGPGFNASAFATRAALSMCRWLGTGMFEHVGADFNPVEMTHKFNQDSHPFARFHRSLEDTLQAPHWPPFKPNKIPRLKAVLHSSTTLVDGIDLFEQFFYHPGWHRHRSTVKPDQLHNTWHAGNIVPSNVAQVSLHKEVTGKQRVALFLLRMTMLPPDFRKVDPQVKRVLQCSGSLLFFTWTTMNCVPFGHKRFFRSLIYQLQTFIMLKRSNAVLLTYWGSIPG